MKSFNPPSGADDHEPAAIEELQQLLMRWEADELDDTGVQRVREIMHGSESARQHYVQWQMVHAALCLGDDVAGPVASTPAEHPIRTHATPRSGPEPSSAIGRARVFLAIAAGLVMCVLASRWAYLESRTGQSEKLLTQSTSTMDPAGTVDESEETSQGIALITRLVDVAWADDSQRAAVGEALMPGPLAIESGFAQVEFFCGATVIVEGPAMLELESTTHARVIRGRLRAQVPPAARGFELKVDDMRVVDLGTEFGLSVSDAGADVQVFDGEVELHRPDTEKKLVTKGQSFIRNPTGDLAPSELTPEKFVDIAHMAIRDEDQTDARHQRWQAYSRQLRRRPSMIAYYAFDSPEPWERKLANSNHPANPELDGAIVGAKYTTGRWRHKGALEFKRPGDRLRVQIPGEHGSLTLACWVKIDSLDRWYNSLFLTDNYQQGEPHWQILDTGQLFLSVRVSAQDGGQVHRPVLSPPFWQPSMSGQWLHLATTYDVQRKRTTHYVNGTQLSQESIPDQQLVSTTRIGRATIGNWSLPTKPDESFAIRNLNGSIDEFALLGEVLSADEIREMYEMGQP
tara:strand:+ start:167928 stop:169643 length:1716 start_codon:yes stop_codon:yes gene_type:complete